MAISNIPTFTDGEILTASKMNTLGTAITTKFAGAVTGADMAWPLVAQGNIDMNQSYTFTNLRTLWKIINVDEYDTLSDAVAALPSAGGALFVPPNTTITADGVAMTKPVLVYGAGKTSVLKLTSAASSGYLIRATGTNDVDFHNLTLDGNSATGSAQDGIQLRQIDGARITNVWFKNFSGSHLQVGNEGTGGNNSIDVMVHNCKFEGGSVDQLKINDVDGMTVSACRFANPTGDCIEGTPTDTSAKMRSITVSGCVMSDCTRGIYVVGASATANDLWRLISVSNNTVLTSSGTGITVGAASAVVKHSSVIDNRVIGTTANALVVNIEGGQVTDNYAPAAGAKAIDLELSKTIKVSGNEFESATTIGIDATATTSVRIWGNDVIGAGTEGIDTNGATTPYVIDNLGHVSAPATTGWWHNGTGLSHTGDTNETTLHTLTIPAGTIVQAGQGLRIRGNFNHSGAGSSEGRVKLDGELIALSTVVSNEMNWFDCFVVNNSATNQESAYFSQEPGSGTNDDVGDDTSIASDFTTDIDLVFSVQNDDGSATAELRHFVVEVMTLEAL